MGRIPKYLETIFPYDSRALLNLTSNIGLVLFLFVVGMEVDVRLIRQNLRLASSVGIAGIIVPMGLGFALSRRLWEDFMGGHAEHGTFGNFLIFIGVAMSITAFPVLARILTELKLLHTTVGVVVLAAGVGNDIAAWVLLALAVALVSASKGIIALYIILSILAFVLCLVLVVRPMFMAICKKAKTFEKGPSESIVCLVIIMVFAAAFFTDIIGVHPIFGGFMIGTIIPKDGGLTVKLTEKIEDLVSSLFLPLYFASSGLRTNIGLINDRKSWGFTILIIVVAFLGKAVPSTLAAKVNGFLWREAMAVGTLMSCKGLVELIVLNLGLSVGILSEKVFSMFVFEAVLITFITTPLTATIYPSSYQNKVARWRAGEIDWDGNQMTRNGGPVQKSGGENPLGKVMIVFDSIEQMAPTISVMQLFSSHAERGTNWEKSFAHPASFHGLRLIELTQRTSAVMQVADVENIRKKDALLDIYRTFARLHHIRASSNVMVVPENSYGETVLEELNAKKSDLVVISWLIDDTGLEEHSGVKHYDPGSVGQRVYTQKVFDEAPCAVAVLLDRGLAVSGGREDIGDRGSINKAIHGYTSDKELESGQDNGLCMKEHILRVFLPIFGGPDDFEALRIVLELASRGNVTVRIVHLRTRGSSSNGLTTPAPAEKSLVKEYRDTIRTFHGRRSSSPADGGHTKDESHEGRSNANDEGQVGRESREQDLETARMDAQVRKWKGRHQELEGQVDSETVVCSEPLVYALERARSELRRDEHRANLVVVGRTHDGEVQRRIRRDLMHLVPTPAIPNHQLRQCLGDVADGFASLERNSNLLVIGSKRSTNQKY